jgi:hypothetical protein
LGYAGKIGRFWLQLSFVITPLINSSAFGQEIKLLLNESKFWKQRAAAEPVAKAYVESIARDLAIASNDSRAVAETKSRIDRLDGRVKDLKAAIEAKVGADVRESAFFLVFKFQVEPVYSPWGLRIIPRTSRAGENNESARRATRCRSRLIAPVGGEAAPAAPD